MPELLELRRAAK